MCRLKRSIYGLRQAARCWNMKLQEVLAKLGFTPSTADQCLFIKKVGPLKIFILVYVDDMLVASTDDTQVKHIVNCLKDEFELTCLGEVRHFLGVEVQRNDSVFKLRLPIYIDQLIAKFGMDQAKTANSPMDPGFVKTVDISEDLADATKYRSLVGGILYLAVTVRPDLAVSASILGRKFAKPNERDWSAAKRVLRYLKATRDYYLYLNGGEDSVLSGYTDSDWADDVETRRSTSGFVFMFGDGAISWASRRQSCVTLSSMEAEYVALSEACQEALWLRQLLRDFDEEQQHPTVLKEDNQGCISFVTTERTSRRSKHIDTKERFVEELCINKQVVLEYCPTEWMAADVLTKPLGPLKLKRFREMLGVMEQSKNALH